MATSAVGPAPEQQQQQHASGQAGPVPWPTQAPGIQAGPVPLQYLAHGPTPQQNLAPGFGGPAPAQPTAQPLCSPQTLSQPPQVDTSTGVLFTGETVTYRPRFNICSHPPLTEFTPQLASDCFNCDRQIIEHHIRKNLKVARAIDSCMQRLQHHLTRLESIPHWYDIHWNLQSMGFMKEVFEKNAAFETDMFKRKHNVGSARTPTPGAATCPVHDNMRAN